MWNDLNNISLHSNGRRTQSITLFQFLQKIYRTNWPNNRMESFALFREHLATSGIIEQKPPFSSRRFNFRNLAVIVWTSLCGMATLKLSNEATTLVDYVNIAHVVVFVCLFTSIYAHIVWNTQQLYGVVNSLEDMINKSMY